MSPRRAFRRSRTCRSSGAVQGFRRPCARCFIASRQNPSRLTVRAVRFHKPGDLRVEDIPRPGALLPDQVRIRVRAAGICGSDVHNFRTGMWLAQLPVTPGHEFSGEVVEVGADVLGFSVGDLVVADSRVPCGRCPHCLAGRANLCISLASSARCATGASPKRCCCQPGLLRVASDIAPEIAALCSRWRWHCMRSGASIRSWRAGAGGGGRADRRSRGAAADASSVWARCCWRSGMRGVSAARGSRGGRAYCARSRW